MDIYLSEPENCVLVVHALLLSSVWVGCVCHLLVCHVGFGGVCDCVECCVQVVVGLLKMLCVVGWLKMLCVVRRGEARGGLFWVAMVGLVAMQACDRSISGS